MRKITKSHAPKELQAFNTQYPNASYEQLKNESIIDEKNEPVLDNNGKQKKLKNIVRAALVKEQGGICCYCMQRLKENKTVIEHFKPQSIHTGENNTTDLRTDYTNLFASCDGGKKTSTANLYCDNNKKKSELSVLKNLSTTGFNTQKRTFTYNRNFKIHSKNTALKKEIETVLNLNCLHLVNKRKGVWNSITRDLRNKAGIKNWEDSKKPAVLDLAKELRDKHKKRNKDGLFYPFCEMIVYRLERKFKALRP